MVEIYGSSRGNHCQSTGWGQAADERFVVNFISDLAFGVQNGEQQLRAAYLLADQSTTSTYVPSLLCNTNCAGGVNRVTRQSAGVYLVELPGMLPVNSATV